jgi:hypothetical protein
MNQNQVENSAPLIIFLAEEGVKTVNIHRFDGPCDCRLCKEKGFKPTLIVDPN